MPHLIHQAICRMIRGEDIRDIPGDFCRRPAFVCRPREYYQRPCAGTICCAWNWYFRIPFADLMRGIKSSIDALPPFLCSVPQHGKLELERLPIGIEDDMHHDSFVS